MKKGIYGSKLYYKRSLYGGVNLKVSSKFGYNNHKSVKNFSQGGSKKSKSPIKQKYFKKPDNFQYLKGKNVVIYPNSNLCLIFTLVWRKRRKVTIFFELFNYL